MAESNALRTHAPLPAEHCLEAARQQIMLQERIDQLSKRAEFAKREGRNDLARAAQLQQADFQSQLAGLDDGQTVQARAASR